jgi:hypothetical protein
MATKSRKKGKNKTGDPITVGGGGGKRKRGNRRQKAPNPVFITFNDATYPDPGGANKKKLFEHATGTMKSLVVYIDYVATNLTSLVPDPAEGDCKVTVKGKGSTEDIEIFSNKLGVRLHTGKYPPESGNRHQSNDATNFIQRVKVTSDTGGSYDSGKLTGANAVKVIADLA